MKILLNNVLIFTLIILTSSCRRSDKPVPEKMISSDTIEIPFPIKRGINISHWLSQNERSNAEVEHLFTEQDIRFIASIGYDHIRLPVDEVHLWDESGQKLPDGFRLLKNAIVWCHANNLRTIVDLHIIRSHYFNSESNTLWTDEGQRNRFISMWMQLSDELKDFSTGMVAYELLNEAVAENPDDWNNLVAATVKAIREREPKRKIVIGSNGWQSPDTFDKLVIPEGDKNIILSFHFYDPHIVTHYKAFWENTGKYSGPISYPGRSIQPEDLKGLNQTLVEELKQYTKNCNKDSLLARIRKPIEYAKRTGLPLYCGEFGCILSTPRDVRLNWYKDITDIFESNNIAWANWDYKGGFAIFNVQTGEPDEELIGVLVGRR